MTNQALNDEFKIISSKYSISIFTSSDEIFISLANKMRANFSRTIGQKNKILAFFSPNELVQRRYFFKLLSKINSRINGDLSSFDTLSPSNIKLCFKRENSLQALLDVPLKFDRNSVIFELKNCDEILCKYFIKMIGAKCDKVAYLLRFGICNTKELERLSDMITFKEHLRYTLNFIYDKASYDEFCALVGKIDSKGFKLRFDALASLLEEHFITLECNINDDFATIRQNYLRLTKLYHPDHLNGANTSELRAKFQEINFAYEALKPFFAEQDKFLKGTA